MSPGLTPRPARSSDLAGVFRLMAENDTHILGAPDYDESELRDDWRPVSLGDDVRVVEDADGSIVGYALAVDRDVLRPAATIYVHYRVEGHGIGTWLSRWVEDRARAKLHLAPDGARVALEATTHADYEPATQLLTDEGYAFERYFLRMTIDLGSQAPPSPLWPPGIALRTFVSGADDEAV